MSGGGVRADTTLLGRLRELDEKATAGPWEVFAGEPPHRVDGVDCYDVLGPYPMQDEFGAGWMTRENAVLISELRNSLPAVARLIEAAHLVVKEAGHYNDGVPLSPAASHLADALAPFQKGTE